MGSDAPLPCRGDPGLEPFGAKVNDVYVYIRIYLCMYQGPSLSQVSLQVRFGSVREPVEAEAMLEDGRAQGDVEVEEVLRGGGAYMLTFFRCPSGVRTMVGKMLRYWGDPPYQPALLMDSEFMSANITVVYMRMARG